MLGSSSVYIASDPTATGAEDDLPRGEAGRVVSGSVITTS